MTKDLEMHTVGEAMEVIPEQDLIFIATYNPEGFRNMCLMWSLEIQLEKEGKLPTQKSIILKSNKPPNWPKRLWYRMMNWLLVKLLNNQPPKTESY